MLGVVRLISQAVVTSASEEWEENGRGDKFTVKLLVGHIPECQNPLDNGENGPRAACDADKQDGDDARSHFVYIEVMEAYRTKHEGEDGIHAAALAFGAAIKGIVGRGLRIWPLVRLLVPPVITLLVTLLIALLVALLVVTLLVVSLLLLIVTLVVTLLLVMTLLAVALLLVALTRLLAGLVRLIGIHVHFDFLFFDCKNTLLVAILQKNTPKNGTQQKRHLRRCLFWRPFPG